MATGTSWGPVASAILQPLERTGCCTRFAGSRPSETRAEKQPDFRSFIDQEGVRAARDFRRIAAQLDGRRHHAEHRNLAPRGGGAGAPGSREIPGESRGHLQRRNDGEGGPRGLLAVVPSLQVTSAFAGDFAAAGSASAAAARSEIPMFRMVPPAIK